MLHFVTNLETYDVKNSFTFLQESQESRSKTKDSDTSGMENWYQIRNCLANSAIIWKH